MRSGEQVNEKFANGGQNAILERAVTIKAI
jgi:hypothetical protein